MGDFDFSFGDLANFSLGGGEGGAVLQPSQFSLGAEGSAPALDPSQFSLGATPGGGAAFDPSTLPTAPSGEPTTFDRVADAAHGVTAKVGGVAKDILPFVGLGTAGVGMAAGIQGAQNSAQQARLARQAQGMQKQTLQAQQAAAAPLTAFGSQELQQAGAGQIPPAIQAKIDSWATGAKAKARDFAARSGQGNSTMLTQWESWIDQQAQAMAADYLQQQQQLGVQSLTAGASAFGGAGQNAASLSAGASGQEAGIAKLMDEANRALASLSAGAA